MIRRGIVIILTLCSFSSAVAQFENNPLSQAIDNTQYDVMNFSPGWQVTNSSSTAGGSSAISSIIANDDVAVMSILFLDTIGRGGRISFDWRLTNISSGSTLVGEIGDELFFVISDLSGNVLETDDINRENDWERVTFDIPNQDVILNWIYFEREGNLEFAPSGNLDGRAWVDNVRITQNGSSLPPACTTTTSNLNSALDNIQYDFSSNSFVCQANDYTTGGSAAQSPEDLTRFATAALDAEIVGPVDILFDWKIDAGVDDLFELRLDNEVIETLTSSTEWATRRISIPEGQHTLRWFYRRFSVSTVNSNSGFVDHLRSAEFTNIRENGGSVIVAPIIQLLLDE